MTRPVAHQSATDDVPGAWTLNGLGGSMMRKNGILVTCCLSLIVFQIRDKRERDGQVVEILMSNLLCG